MENYRYTSTNCPGGGGGQKRNDLALVPGPGVELRSSKDHVTSNLPQRLELLMVQGLFQETQLFNFGVFSGLQHFEVGGFEAAAHNLAHLGLYVQQLVFQRCRRIP
jgi:hypothetical protein